MSDTYSVTIEDGTAKAAMENVREIMSRQDDNGLEIALVRNPNTGNRYEYDPRHGMMLWRAVTGDKVSLTPDEWRDLAEELPKVMDIFGI